ncbi:hypothetical protein KIL84_021041 [Mauremys mutica]|uniref:Uncharacterized protein n=1 Tax=Mauremys mutica TaxID=74926 RepID=A0A9D4AU20_9SAUR|nr:hypothetical protein KIL84_021041 [Mauremys mutica]
MLSQRHPSTGLSQSTLPIPPAHSRAASPAGFPLHTDAPSRAADGPHLTPERGQCRQRRPPHTPASSNIPQTLPRIADQRPSRAPRPPHVCPEHTSLGKKLPSHPLLNP